MAILSVTTDAATGIASTSATLNGTVVTDGPSSNRCSFQWGTTASLGTATATQNPSSTGTVSVSETLTGLTPGTMYYFRIRSSSGIAGATLTFTTPAGGGGGTSGDVPFLIL